ncbi:MAG: tetratricopeptide repeat protein [Candidatus Binataceae bacterium]|jgi:tetratricopeptide (TPR) repeat protein
MKWTGNQRPATHRLTIVAAIMAGALASFGLAGCQHKSVDDNLAAGNLAMQNTKLADAESDYQQAASMAPNDPRPHVALGNLYVFEQKPSQAETEYMKVLELDAHNGPAHTALGNVFAGQSQPGLAEEQYRAAVAIDSVNPAYRINLATLLQKQGKLGEAEAHLRTAIGLDGRNARAHLALAKVLSAEPDRRAEAEAEFARVRTLDPSLLPGAAPAPEPAAGAASPTTPPPGPPMTTSAPPPAPARAPQVKVRELNRRFLLTHDSPVYGTPQESANVIAQVHRRKYVKVTGIAGNWLRIRMKNGTVGFVPVTAAE